MGNSSRLPLLDFLRGAAAQIIVWHHLAFYGPLSDHARVVAGGAIDWLAEYGRLAVQVFFVIGGFLTARSLAARPPRTLYAAGGMMLGRYRRIALPYVLTLALAIVANEVARGWMQHPSISASPTTNQVLAHLLLLHDVLGYEALTAGIWYLAIDLQLVMVATFVHWIGIRVVGAARGPACARTALALLGIASLMSWNRQPSLDRYAIYFLGSYALGMTASWVQQRLVRTRWFWTYVFAAVIALTIEFRSRLLLAAGVSVLLLVAGQKLQSQWARSGVGRWLADTSFSLFLVHFPVCLMVNAWWSHHLPPAPWLSLAGMVVAYGASLACAHVLHRSVAMWQSSWRTEPVAVQGPAPVRAVRQPAGLHASGFDDDLVDARGHQPRSSL